jgi:hypothetical protein
MAAAITACAGSISSPTRIEDSASGGRIELTAEGGIAALLMSHSVNYSDRKFVYTQRHICSASCGAPLDSASGILPAATTDSLFNGVLALSPFTLKDDYGTTRNAADMMTYTLRITADGRTKTVRADDGTMPAEMRRIVSALNQTVSAARR